MTMFLKMKLLVGLCGLILVLFVSHTEQAKKHAPTSYATDCTDIKKKFPESPSGIYMIRPAAATLPFLVYCEMAPDGGWTVFQRRSGPELSFAQKWKYYEHSFGNLNKDFWLGLKYVHQLTNSLSKKCILRVDLMDHEGNYAYALYTDFWVGNSQSNYKLHVDQYSGTAGDAIRGAFEGIDQNGYGFSTMDRDNDGCDPCISGDIAFQCSMMDSGGWWFSKCGSASLNGDYHPSGDHIGWSSGLHWHTWKKTAPYSLKMTRMMVKAV